MAGPTTPIGVLAVGGGVALIWSAFTGQSPLAELRKALATGRVDGSDGIAPIAADDPPPSTSTSTAYDAGVAAGSGVLAGAAAAAISGATSGRPELVAIGQGSHKLAPAAAASFARVQQRFGRAIKISDSVRDYDQQAASYASDPTRFASPNSSAHVMGLAVDVDLGAIGANPTGNSPGSWPASDATFGRLHAAFTSEGWCNWQIRGNSTKGKINEPWHYSYGGCR